jgi:hypothetical protein
MSTFIITYEAKCKHCLNRVVKKNPKNRDQSFCEVKQEFIRLKDKACEKFAL